ncbi:MAG: hypothetical protein J6T37_00890 [Bacteroidales bacterium]|nr:hypothetical protein [Bacteroidales bacterium]
MELDFDKMQMFDFNNLTIQKGISDNCAICDISEANGCDSCDYCDHGW